MDKIVITFRPPFIFFLVLAFSFPHFASAEIKLGPKATYFSGKVVGEDRSSYSGYGIGPRFMYMSDITLFGVDLFRTYPVIKGRDNIKDASFEGVEIGPFFGFYRNSWFLWLGYDVYDEMNSINKIEAKDGTTIGNIRFNGNAKRIGLGFVAFEFLTINLELKNHLYTLSEVSGGDISKEDLPSIDVETNVIHLFLGFYFR